MKAPNGKSHAGFTLVELLVAVAIFSVLLVTIYSSFTSGVAARDMGEALADIAYVGHEALGRLASDLANSRGLVDPSFLGEADRMSFVSLQRGRENRTARLCHVYYGLMRDDPGEPGSLLKTRGIFGDSREEIDLTGRCVQGLSFSYAYRERGEGGIRWSRYWFATEGEPLPVAVRIAMTLESDGQTIEISRTVRIPVSYGLEETIAGAP
jgi:prepilin-type N-terminal cleavage/methylation domain-containing protein